MKLLYATSIKYPSALANRIQVVSMSRAFADLLGGNFYLGGNKIETELPAGAPVVNFGVKKSWRLAWRCLKFAKKEKISHIYCREARLLFFIVFYNAVFFGLPLCFAYEVHALLGRSALDYLTDGFLILFVDRYFFVTEALKKIYGKKYFIGERKTFVAPDAVDLAIFNIPLTKEEARRRLDLPLEKKIIGFCGQFKTLTMDKGIDNILAALKNLPPEVLFVAVGGNQGDIAEYEGKAKRAEMTERIKLIGHVDQRDLAVYQKAFDVLLMPFPRQTHFAYYMSPLKMFEYMASGRPIVTTDLPSVREVLNEGNAVIVPVDNPDALSSAVNVLLADSELAERLAERAFFDVQNHTWRRRAEKIIQVLQN